MALVVVVGAVVDAARSPMVDVAPPVAVVGGLLLLVSGVLLHWLAVW